MDTGIHVLIQEIVIHVKTHNINLYILITKYQSIYSDYITILYYILLYTCNSCILIHNEHLLYGWHVTVQ